MRRFGGSAVICCLLFVFPVISAAQSTSPQGQWSALENWPTRAIHTALLPDGRVFFFSYYAESQQPNIWDPVTDTFSATTAAPYELFCAGHTSMADGRIFIAGGHIADYTGYAHALIYDPFQNTMTPVADMNQGRWYPTVTELPNGDLLVTSGDVDSNTNVDTLPQVFQVSTGTWRNLTSAQLLQALYPVMFVAPNGQVIYAGPEPETRYLDTTGTGAWTTVGYHQFSGWRDYGPGLMYDSGKILEVGGSDPPVASAETIDLTAASPAWSYTGSMNYPRRQHNAVILPDGKVFVVGGSSGSGFDDNTNPVYPTEMWDPATGKFSVMASIAAYRGYHSTALLLPDGRVLSAGGNVGGANGQVFSPPYLFNGARPAIASAPASAGYGQTVFIGTPDAAGITQVSWIRTPSTTHTFDESARFMRLSFTQASGGLNVTMPANGNIAPPGHYMLFLLNGAGVPSVAKIVQISANGGSSGTLTGVVTNTAGQPLAGAQVTAGNSSASTLADGTYSMQNVTAGSATVSASLAGYQSASQPVTASAGTTTSVPTIQLAPLNPGTVTGTVVTSGGSPVAGASVSADGVTATTNAGGSYTLANLPAGAVTLTVSAPGEQTATQSATVVAGSSTTVAPVTLTSNAGNVTGKVTDSSGNAIAGASVGFGGASTTTDSTGAYSLDGIPAGTIQLVASATEYQSVTQTVAITGGNTTTANFSLALSSNSPGTVAGVVTNISTGQAISGASVKWNTTTATTDSNGNYSLANVSAGTQTVTASATGYLPVSSSTTVAGGTSTLNFQLSTAGILNVTVVNSAGAAVAAAPVKLSGGIIATSLSGATNSAGQYSSNWIPIGSYTVTSGSVSEAATVNTGQTTSITLTQAGSTATTGTISGTVTSSSGAALAGATVSSGSASVTSQANGSYTLAAIPAGTVSVTASLGGYQTATQSVSVTAGTTASANFTLTPASSTGSVTGKVTNISNGMALAGATVKWNSTAVSTNSSGVYTISNVSAGSETLTGSANGYLARTGTVTVSGGATATLNLQLATAGIIKVTAVSSSGAADSGATVTIAGGVISTTVTGKTNSSGVYNSNWIPVGSYTVTISKTGHTTQSKTVSISAGQTAAIGFTF
ncbi:MAG: carboxypeptidase regulatory-like domain-containing protein [Acidobacteria bacterium]|nr:carboxypeptidase regulatory-like domain-containing protein [Acidobacteriota bacterium]